jgi:hypothetical protein
MDSGRRTDDDHGNMFTAIMMMRMTRLAQLPGQREKATGLREREVNENNGIVAPTGKKGNNPKAVAFYDCVGFYWPPPCSQWGPCARLIALTMMMTMMMYLPEQWASSRGWLCTF